MTVSEIQAKLRMAAASGCPGLANRNLTQIKVSDNCIKCPGTGSITCERCTIRNRTVRVEKNR